jgi:hypothetical protein
MFVVTLLCPALIFYTMEFITTVESLTAQATCVWSTCHFTNMSFYHFIVIVTGADGASISPSME